MELPLAPLRLLSERLHLPSHTVDYDPFIESQLALRTKLLSLIWCKFGQATLKISSQHNPRRPSCGKRSVCDRGNVRNQHDRPPYKVDSNGSIVNFRSLIQEPNYFKRPDSHFLPVRIDFVLGEHATLWSSTLLSKVNLYHAKVNLHPAIDFRAFRGSNLGTYPAEFRGVEILKLHRVGLHLPIRRSAFKRWVHQPSDRGQIAFFRSLICTGAHRILAICGAHQGNRKIRFAPALRVGGCQELSERLHFPIRTRAWKRQRLADVVIKVII